MCGRRAATERSNWLTARGGRSSPLEPLQWRRELDARVLDVEHAAASGIGGGGGGVQEKRAHEEEAAGTTDAPGLRTRAEEFVRRSGDLYAQQIFARFLGPREQRRVKSRE